MSFARLVYYGTIVGGWMAFIGWLTAEFIFLRTSGQEFGFMSVAVMCATIGAAVGAGLNVVSGSTGSNWKQIVLRGIPGLLGGLVGGALGGSVANALVYFGLPRAVGFMVLGLAIGTVEGIYERSPNKLRNGIIGGLAGGLLGGLLFDWLLALTSSHSGISSRATAFVVLGASIGLMISLAQVVLKQAWLTVVDGFGAGRQLILSQTETVIGRGDHLPLPLLGQSSQQVEREHAMIARRKDGRFIITDKGSKLGTFVNHEMLKGERVLLDSDVIKIGGNFIRFNERRKDAATASASRGQLSKSIAPPPPPATKSIATPPASPRTSTPPKPAQATAPDPSIGPTQTPAKERRIPAPPPPPPVGPKKQ